MDEIKFEHVVKFKYMGFTIDESLDDGEWKKSCGWDLITYKYLEFDLNV